MADRISAEFGSAPDFPLLADPDHKVIDRYGLLNPERVRGYVVPHPAVFVIDYSGKVRWKFTTTDASQRPDNTEIQKVLKEIGSEAP